MENHYSGHLSRLHLCLDLVLLNLAFFISFQLRFDSWQVTDDAQYANLLLVFNLLWVLISYLSDTYTFTRLSYTERIPMAAKFSRSMVLHFAVIAIGLYLTKQGYEYSRYAILATYTLFLVSGILGRLFAVFSVNYFRAAGLNICRYGIVGTGIEGNLIRNYFRERKELGYLFCGDLSKEPVTPGKIEEFIIQNRLDFLYCCLSNLNLAEVQTILHTAEKHRTQVRLIPDLKGFVSPHVRLEYHDACPVMKVETKPFESRRDELVKRIFDLAFSSVVMVAGLPVFLVVMVLVRVSSPGPVFFRQERTGRWGKKFTIFKFRTMCVDAEKFGMQHSTGDSDPRITPIGKILRKTRLDELPQFYNVMKGDMSIVGPRPLNHYDVNMLMEAASHDFQRVLTVPPGITSIGQIKVGYASNLAENLNRLSYDIQYLTPYSLVRDIQLILLTVQVMVLGRGK